MRTIDLFCGAGGSSWGARAAGAEIVAAIDSWNVAVANYNDNFGDRARCICLSPTTGAEVLGAPGPVDLVLASPECTNHTCARGNRPRIEASRDTARYVLRFARDLRPRWIVIENVVHMLRWEGYPALLDELRKEYYVRVQRLDAADFGVPQNRRRLFILCDRRSKPREVLPPSGITTATVENIIDWGGPWKSSPLHNGRRAAPTLERANRAIEALGRGVPFLLVYYGSDAAGGWQPLNRPIRTLTTLDRFGLVTWEGKIPMLRMLQVPELRRAMGFSEEYRLEHGTRREQIKALGNGVCPPVMTAIVETLTGAPGKAAVERPRSPSSAEVRFSSSGQAAEPS